MLKYAIFNHQGKGDAYQNILSTKYKRVSPPPPYFKVKFVFTDNDIRGRKSHLSRIRRIGAECFFVYPHTGRPNLVNDINEPWAHTDACFVAADGHREIMRTYGYKKPIYVVGWTLCPQKEFEPTKVESVLFAPIHPRCAHIDKEANRMVMRKLLDVKVNVTVRHVGILEKSGLKRHKGIRYTEAGQDIAWEQIDHSDLIIGHQTFAYLAVARGRPTVMMGERMIPTHILPADTPPIYAKNWDKYVDLLAYPYDILEGDTLELFDYASKNEATEWRKRMIGGEFKPNLVLKVVDHYVKKATSKSEYQGKGKYYIINPKGAIHTVSKKFYEEMLPREGWRNPTDKQILRFRQNRIQTFDKPIGEKYDY